MMAKRLAFQNHKDCLDSLLQFAKRTNVKLTRRGDDSDDNNNNSKDDDDEEDDEDSDDDDDKLHAVSRTADCNILFLISD